MNDKLLNIEQAAQYLNVSKTTLRRWTKSGTLACMRVGAKGERRFLQKDLDTCLLESGEQRPIAVPPRPPRADPLTALREGAAKGVPKHVCLHFQDRDELWDLFRPYVRFQMKNNAPILYIHDPAEREDVMTRFRSEGWEPEALIANGLLRLMLPEESYLRSGVFVAERMIDFMESAILGFRSAGHTTVLLSGEMNWYMGDAPGVVMMFNYERLLNTLLLRYPDVTIVCHYDMHRMSGAAAIGAMCSHPHVHLPHQFRPGYYAQEHSAA
jgi:excisionase family DNA binding protein